MQCLVWLCLVAGAAPPPNVEDQQPARAERGTPSNPTPVNIAKGELMVWCVRSGLSPDQVRRVFGSPLLQEQFRDGPVEWWYPEFGVRVYFPRTAFPPPKAAMRIRGGIY